MKFNNNKTTPKLLYGQPADDKMNEAAFAAQMGSMHRMNQKYETADWSQDPREEEKPSAPTGPHISKEDLLKFYQECVYNLVFLCLPLSPLSS
jgi:hypothetical protein